MREITLGLGDLLAISAEVDHAGDVLPVAVPVRGTSMVPFIRGGDVANIRPIHGAGLARGEVALYQSAGLFILHRVVRRDIKGSEVAYRIRGDSQLGRGEAVRAEQILGRVVSIERRGRTVLMDTARLRLCLRLWNFTRPLGPIALLLLTPVRRLIMRRRASETTLAARPAHQAEN